MPFAAALGLNIAEGEKSGKYGLMFKEQQKRYCDEAGLTRDENYL